MTDREHNDAPDPGPDHIDTKLHPEVQAGLEAHGLHVLTDEQPSAPAETDTDTAAISAAESMSYLFAAITEQQPLARFNPRSTVPAPDGRRLIAVTEVILPGRPDRPVHETQAVLSIVQASQKGVGGYGDDYWQNWAESLIGLSATIHGLEPDPWKVAQLVRLAYNRPFQETPSGDMERPEITPSDVYAALGITQPNTDSSEPA